MNEQQQIVELLKEQNELLRRHLWRLRFSLLFLLLMTTALCFGLGFLVYQNRPKASRPAIIPTTQMPNSTLRLSISTAEPQLFEAKSAAPQPSGAFTPDSFLSRDPLQPTPTE